MANEFEDKDLQSLKEYAIANGAGDEVNACKDRACVFAFIKHLRISFPPARPIEEVLAEIEKMDEEAAKSKASVGASLKL